MSVRRQLLQRRYFQRVKERRNRLNPGATAQWDLFAFPVFIDYHPEIPGTLPEKHLFEALADRRINFQFSKLLGDSPLTPDHTERMRPDFVLPDYMVVIEVAGTYWHSRPEHAEHDRQKHALMTAMGYKVYIFTDLEIVAAVEEVLNKIPELVTATIFGTNIEVDENRFDPIAGIRGRFQKWPKGAPTRYKSIVRGEKAVLEAWKMERAPKKADPELDDLFVSADIYDAYEDLFKTYGGNFANWISSLRTWAQDPAAARRNQALYDYVQAYDRLGI